MRLKDRPGEDRDTMTWDDTFRFRCHPDIDCFNSCCRDVTIFLNPLDVPRLRKALGISSQEFLEKYTVSLVSEQSGMPAVVLKMADDEHKACPFVTEAGCSVYNSRPYSCRLYPLDTEQGVEYGFIVDSGRCHGLSEDTELTVEEWRRDQALGDYDDIDHTLKDVMHADQVWEGPIEDPRMQQMIRTALYDPDRFREFIFKSSFLDKFEVDADILEKIKEDDTALLHFAGEWLRYSLFGKRTVLKYRKEYLEEKKKEVFGS